MKEHFYSFLIEKERELIEKHEADVKKKFSASVLSAFSKLKKKTSNTFVVAVDGSKFADNAFNTMMSLRKNNDNVIVYHSYEKSDAELPPEYHCETIKLKYETALVGTLPVDHFYLSFLERPAGVSKREAFDALTTSFQVKFLSEKTALYFGRHSPDFLVVGFSGRRSEGTNSTFMGSGTDLALRNSVLPCIVVKGTCPSLHEPKSFVVAVNSSEICKQGIKVIYTLLKGRDKLTILHVCHESMDNFGDTGYAKLKEYYMNELQIHGHPDATFVAIPCDAGKNVGETLTRFVNDELQPDFLAVCPRAKETVVEERNQVNNVLNLFNTYYNLSLISPISQTELCISKHTLKGVKILSNLSTITGKIIAESLCSIILCKAT